MTEHVLTLDGLGAASERPAGESRGPAAWHRETAQAGRSARAARRKGSIEYRLLYAVTFVAFLFAAIFEALIPFRARSRDGIIQKARFGAQTCVKYAFMG